LLRKKKKGRLKQKTQKKSIFDDVSKN